MYYLVKIDSCSSRTRFQGYSIKVRSQILATDLSAAEQLVVSDGRCSQLVTSD